MVLAGLMRNQKQVCVAAEQKKQRRNTGVLHSVQDDDFKARSFRMTTSEHFVQDDASKHFVQDEDFKGP
jgi:hypothetical protein